MSAYFFSSAPFVCSRLQWMPFFPGFKFDGVSTVPHISYSLSPAVALQPDHSNARTIWYAKIDKGSSGLDHCLSEHHPTWPAPRLHHGTPFYRATLCERGCVPDIHNTVFITLFHVGLNPRYPKYVFPQRHCDNQLRPLESSQSST